MKSKIYPPKEQEGSRKQKTRQLVTTLLYKTGRSLIPLFLLFFTLLIHSSSLATHVVGGGITYDQLENNNYLITVKLYRDCSPGTAQLPGNVNLNCRRGFDGSTPAGYGNPVLPLVSVTQINPDIPACAFDPGICVEEAIYQDIINIPPGAGGYHLYYTICCRNGTITNIDNPLAAQETFYAYIPDNSIHPNNSSPYFVDMPPVYVCAGQPLDLSFAANDINNDSLVYSFYTPYDGQNNGGITFNAGNPPDNINISPIIWEAGFGATDPLDATPGLTPGLTIDNNGYITGTPPAPGQYVVGVMVDEYRDGVLIGRVTRDFQFNVINCPPPVQAGIALADSCNGLNIAFTNTSTGGVNPTYWWDFGTNNPADTSLAFEPNFTYPTEGDYTVTLIVQKGTECSDTITYDLTALNPVTFNVDVDSVSCNGFGDGSALATSNDPQYIYEWSNLQTGTSVSNLNPGNYWVKASNSIGCVDTQLFLVEEPNPLAVQFNQTSPLCNGDQNGSLQAIPSGGTTPYAYFWPIDNSSNATLINVGAGNYQVQLTDAAGCYLAQSGAVTQPSALLTTLVNQVDVACHGENTGSVTVNVIGGVGNYTIDWVNLPNDNFTMNNLPAGTHIAEVADGNGCMEVVIADIQEPDSLTVDIIIVGDETCTAANGSAFADVNGGIGQMTYLWNPTGQTTALATSLSSGAVSVIVEDENGCQDQADAFINDHPTGTASLGNSTPVSCPGGNDGFAEVVMNGGTSPFHYNWSCNCVDQNSQNTLTAGNYSVEVIDNNGCIDSINFSIQEIAPMIIDFITMTTPSCNGMADGSIETGINGGTAPYTYSWNTQPNQQSAIASGLSAGDYTLSLTDDNGCVLTADTTLTEPEVLQANAQVIGNIICYGDSAGVIMVEGIGGTAPYSPLWIETNETTDTINSLPAGTYNVTVTDANGCQASDQTQIIEYEEVTAEITHNSGFCPGDIVDFYVATNGLNNQYDYYWYVNQNLESTSNTFSYAIADTSEIAIVMVNTVNCPSVQDTVTIGPIMIPADNVSAFATPDSICYGSDAALSATIDNNSNIAYVFWNHSSLTGLGPHTVSPEMGTDYIVTIQNVCGDQQSDTARINVFLPPNTSIFADNTIGCDKVEALFGYDYEAYDYTFEGAYWEINQETYHELNPQVSFNYSAGVPATAYLTFSNGCTFEYTEVIEMTVFESPEANFYFNPDPALQNEITEFVDISHGNPKYWEWYLEGNFISNLERPSHQFDEAGEYEVTQIIVDKNGCSDTMTHVVEVIGNYTVYVPNAFTPDGNSVNNTFKPVISNADPEQYEFMIYNRWGELIYRTEVMDDAWDGRYLGDYVVDGIYIWKILLTDNIGLKHEHMGHVSLLR
ncbi:MAG: PKD domain-containing protein [Crocinitomicaceae bacterium]